MKALFSILFLASLSAQAATPDVYQAVLASPALQQASQRLGSSDIASLKETALFRCPGCYRIEAVIGRGDSAKPVEFATTGVFRNGHMEYSVSEVRNEAAASAGRCIAMGRVGGEDRACAQHVSADACESRDHWEFCKWSTN